ncbi:hypothetical protein PMAYCL1PPCAC_15523, partial [Pristionchus mayeri]
EKISHVFSISKVHQSLAMGLPLIFSSFFSMQMCFAVNLVFGVFALVCYNRSIRKSNGEREEKPSISIDNCA